MKQLINRTSRTLRTLFKKGTGLVLVSGVLMSIVLPSVPKASASTAPIVAAPRVSFTFDDSLASASTNAQPILAKYGFTGTDYVITNCVGMTTAPNTCHANNDAQYMTWDQVTALKAAGWEIGSHTVTHPYLASFDASDGQPNPLTPAQVVQELTQSKADLAAHGIDATDFASPYGDYTAATLVQIAKLYASHRGFADVGYNAFPSNDYLLYDQQVQDGVTLATVEGYVNSAIANNQWLVLTFHDVLPTTTGNPDDYQTSTTLLDQIAAYVKSKNVTVSNVSEGLTTNAGNLLPNASFDSALSSNTADTTSWSTDDPTNIKQDTGNNGSYPSPANSVSLTATTKDTHLFSPQVGVDGSKTYVLKNFLNVNAITAATGHEVAFYVDEYDANGNYLSTQYKKSETTAFVESLNMEYKPTSTAVQKARLQVVVTANSGVKAYLDNVQWFAEDGSTTGTGTTTPPVTPPVTPGKGGGTTLTPGYAYRMVDPKTGDHYYTAQQAQFDAALAQGFVTDGQAFKVSLTPQAGMVPVFNMFNGGATDHWITQDGVDHYWGVNIGGYRDDGIAFYVYATSQAGTVPVYETYNGGIGDHFYSSSTADRDWVVANAGYTNTKVAFYVAQ